MRSSPADSEPRTPDGDDPTPPQASDVASGDESLTRAQLRQRRMTAMFAIIFLIFLVFPAVEVMGRGGWRAWAGLPLLGVFCLVYAGGYLGALLDLRPFHLLTRAGPWPWLFGLVLLTGALTAVIGLSALVCLTYVATGAAASLPSRQALWTIAACGLTVGIGTYVVTGSTAWAIGLGVWVALIGGIVWGSVAMDQHNDALTRAREEKAELAVELERTRLARDLHDILGHSLTVITVKAELAGRLIEVDPARAKAEIDDLERLARDALADVRTTVSGYRQLSLPTELVRARKALEAAGIDAQIPGAADIVDSRWRDLFAWVVREGVTNVVRHSGASRCQITLGTDEVVIRDDGAGPAEHMEPGNGLTGLRERARKVGADAAAGAAAGGGFELRVWAADRPASALDRRASATTAPTAADAPAATSTISQE